MLELIERKRRVVDAVTDGRSQVEEAVVEGVIRSLRGSPPARHLRVAG
jgi:SWI/SNF-related matrix-associated actin-dependent regulator of chromatin subfamily A-like protein 1